MAISQIYEIPEAFTPYARMTRKGKFVDPHAQKYIGSQQVLQYALKQQMQEKGYQMFPEQTPLAVSVVVNVSKRLHGCDLDNQVKAVIDAAQGIVFHNDLWIDRIRAFRKLTDHDSFCLSIEELK